MAVPKGIIWATGSGIKIGLSLTGPRQAETLMRALDVVVRRAFVDCAGDVELLEPSVAPTLAVAHAAGLGVIVRSARQRPVDRAE